jgi:hypothetical protein
MNVTESKLPVSPLLQRHVRDFMKVKIPIFRDNGVVYSSNYARSRSQRGRDWSQRPEDPHDRVLDREGSAELFHWPFQITSD